jgi:plasmid stabilization system protein ParE
MSIRWTLAALGDLARLHEFLHPLNPKAAARVVQRLSEGPDVLELQPRLGTRLTEFEPREVRYLLVGDYELRYEITQAGDIWILRIWHTREMR